MFSEGHKHPLQANSPNIDLKRGFALIELLVVLLIIGILTYYATEEYMRSIERAKSTRAAADIEELLKSVRLFNIRENKQFEARVFNLSELGNFVGNYLETEPPLDPWENPYRHSPEMGVVYSTGPDGIDQTTVAASKSDDLIARYLPASFFITRAEYFDANLNNVIDLGDFIEITFSRPAVLNKPLVIDFETTNPARALGDAIVSATTDPFVARIDFQPPTLPTIRLGETKIYAREISETITDMSPVPQTLKRLGGATINRPRR